MLRPKDPRAERYLNLVGKEAKFELGCLKRTKAAVGRAGLKLDRPQGMLVGDGLTGAMTRAELSTSSGTAAEVLEGQKTGGGGQNEVLAAGRKAHVTETVELTMVVVKEEEKEGQSQARVSQDQNRQGMCVYV